LFARMPAGIPRQYDGASPLSDVAGPQHS
jgi:hypothetical protein